jgi:hypothetical protein
VSAKLTGRYRVRAYSPALREVKRMFNRVGDRMEVRRHVLKLRFWPDGASSVPRGQVLDLDWDWVEGLSFRDVGELRISDVIAGQNNLRIIFHVGGEKMLDPLPVIWVLRVFQKKRMDFTSNDLSVFSERRRQIRRRFYGE